MFTPPLSTGLNGAGPRLRAYLDSLPELTSPSRRAALYADLALLRDTNSFAYERALAWWRKAVAGAAKAGATSELVTHQAASVFCLSADALAAAFERDGIRPAALPTVLETMERDGELRRIEEYAPWLRTWTGWAWNAVATLPRRLFSKHITDGQVFVVMPVLQDMASYAWEIHAGQVHYAVTDRLYTWHEFRTRLGQGRLAEMLVSVRDWELLLVQLEESGRLTVERPALASDTLDAVLIKFALPEEIGQPPLINDTDQGLLGVRRTLHTIAQQAMRLTEEAKGYLGSHAQRQRALGCLRRRKQMESVLQKRLASQDQLNGILLHVQQAESDQEIHGAYAQGAHALQHILQESGLSVQNVDDTIMQLEDALADQREIEDALAAGAGQVNELNGVGVDDEALDAELEALVAAEAKEKADKEAAEVAAQLEALHLPPSTGAPETTAASTASTAVAAEEEVPNTQEEDEEEAKPAAAIALLAE